MTALAYKAPTYCRALDIPALPEFAKIDDLTDALYPDNLHALSREQLRTSLIRFALYCARKRLAPLQPITMLIDACLIEENIIRVDQMTHEAILRREGKQ